MRVKNSIINISTGIGSQLIITILGFISRTLFIAYLGVEYLGINGLFTNVLGMLSLAEAGIGSAIVYSLYKPVAENDQVKIRILMKFYKKTYMVIGIIIFLLGLLMLPFLSYFVKGTTVENIHVIFLIFLLNTVASYLFSHKISLLNVNQKGFIVTSFYTLSTMVSTIIKLLILFYTENYILYLFIDLIVTISTSIILSKVVNNMYPFLKEGKVEEQLDPVTRGTIYKNVKALVLHRLGGYAVFGTDNMIIAAFVSVTAVGFYSNYYMLINICRTLINQVFDNISHSIGNLVAKESNEKIYSIFKVTMLCNFWIYSFFTIALFVILEPFISLWLGSEFIMSEGVLIILLINFYFSGMRRSISTVKTTAGIFHEDRYAPFAEAAINLIASLVLVRYFGITGVFLGTFISTLLVPFWIAPYFVYKKIFLRPVIYYFMRYCSFTIIGVGTCIITKYVSDLSNLNGFWNIIFKIVVCLVIPNLVFLIIFYKTAEFRYLMRIFKSIRLSFPEKFAHIKSASKG